jgi:hypothetical protein
MPGTLEIGCAQHNGFIAATIDIIMRFSSGKVLLMLSIDT